jgi:membrane peptidoglycan carboxypeptidase
MKHKQIRVTINIPHEKLFEYVIEPKNTKFWVSGSIEMTTDTDQINTGTRYSNEFITREVTDYERNKFIELIDDDGNYSCSYTFRKIDDECTELIYFESNADGEDLEYPLELKYFEKLRELLEI